MDKAGCIEDNDVGALTTEQQSKLNEFKIKTRYTNEKYLRSHPEISCLLSSFLSDVLVARPENTREYASTYFSNPELPLKVKAMTQNKMSKIKSSQ